MLNIAELVPPPESVPIPFNSAIHRIPFDAGIPGILFGLNSGIPGIGWIWNQLKLQELNRIPELRGIPGNQ
jgi:hypothetical protein